MPHIIPNGTSFILRPEKEARYHLNSQAHSLSYLSASYTDVTIHCKNDQKVKTNKFVLSQASKMMRDIFSATCSCAHFITFDFDLICPDFSADAMDNVLQILVTGMAVISYGPVTDEMKHIIDNFQIDIKNITSAASATLVHSNRADQGQRVEDDQDMLSSLDNTNHVLPGKTNSQISLDDNALDPIIIRPTEIPAEQIKTEEFQTGTSVSYDCCNKIFSSLEAFQRHNQKHRFIAKKTMKNLSSAIKSEANHDELEKMSNLEGVPENSMKDSSNIFVVNDFEELPPCAPENLQTPPDQAALDGDQTQATQQADAKKVICTLCQHKFTNTRNLVSHILVIHFADKIRQTHGGQIGDKTCLVCSKVLRNEASLFYHLHSAHEFLRKELDTMGITGGPRNRNREQNPPVSSVMETLVKGGKIRRSTLRKEKDNTKRRNKVGKKLIKDGAKGNNDVEKGEEETCLGTEKADKKNNENEKKVETNQRRKEKNKTKAGKERVDAVAGQTAADDAFVYQCKICTKKNSSEFKLYNHIGMSHLKEKILAKYSIDKNSCRKCKAVFNTNDDLVHHLVIEHKVVAKFVTNKKIRATKAKRSEVATMTSAKNGDDCKTETNDQCEADQGFEICSLCPERCSSPQQLQEHLARAHFHAQVSKYYGKNVGECKICSKMMLNMDCLLKHLIVRHDVLNIILNDKEDDASGGGGNISTSQKSPIDSLPTSEHISADAIVPTAAVKKRGRPPKTAKQPSREPTPSRSDLKKDGVNVLETSVKRSTGSDEGGLPHKRRKDQGLSFAGSGETLKCFKCDFKSGSYKNIIGHIAREHFPERLSTLLGKGDLDCGVCDEVFDVPDDVVVHLARQHHVIDFPPEETLKV